MIVKIVYRAIPFMYLLKFATWLKNDTNLRLLFLSFHSNKFRTLKSSFTPTSFLTFITFPRFFLVLSDNHIWYRGLDEIVYIRPFFSFPILSVRPHLFPLFRCGCNGFSSSSPLRSMDLSQ